MGEVGLNCPERFPCILNRHEDSPAKIFHQFAPSDALCCRPVYCYARAFFFFPPPGDSSTASEPVHQRAALDLTTASLYSETCNGKKINPNNTQTNMQRSAINKQNKKGVGLTFCG